METRDSKQKRRNCTILLFWCWRQRAAWNKRTWILSKVWSLWVIGLTESTMTNNHNAKSPSLSTSTALSSIFRHWGFKGIFRSFRLNYGVILCTPEGKSKKEKGINFPSPSQDLCFGVYQCICKCLQAVCAHLCETAEGHLIGRGFPYLPPASGNLKYITGLAEHYFKSLENR